MNKNFMGHLAKRSFEKIHLSAFGGTGQEVCKLLREGKCIIQYKSTEYEAMSGYLLGFSTCVNNILSQRILCHEELFCVL